MGMGASQVRLLQLTNRNLQLGEDLVKLSNEKMELSRAKNKITLEYNKSLSAKVLKWTNNAGVSCTNLSYSLLMRPNSANQNRPYLLTDSAGKVILDSKYAEYASMISPDGRAGGDWSGDTKAKILAALTGISEDKIKNYDSTYATAEEAEKALEKAKTNRDKALENARTYVNPEKVGNYIGKVGNIDFTSSSSIELGTRTEAISILNTLASGMVNAMKNYLEEDDLEKFKTACEETIKNNYINNSLSTDELFNNTATNPVPPAIKKNSKGNAELDVNAFLKVIMSQYHGTQKSTDKGNIQYAVVDLKSDKYQAYLDAQEAYETAKADLASAKDANSQIFDGEVQSKMKFYDQLFTAISENGWKENDNIVDEDYFNQSLQNNNYFITTMSYNDSYDPECDASSCTYKYNYEQDLASNNEQIVMVNDEEIREKALTDYTYQKAIINSKETKIDQRMKDKETEQSALLKMIDSIKQVLNDDVDTYYKVFSA